MKSGLNLNYCKKITDDGLKHLTNMRSGLSLWRCDKITDEGFKYLKQKGIKYNDKLIVF